MKRSKLALVAGVLGALGLFDVVMGPVLIHLGLVSPMFGFQWLFGLGLLYDFWTLNSQVSEINYEGLLPLHIGHGKPTGATLS